VEHLDVTSADGNLSVVNIFHYIGHLTVMIRNPA